MNATYKGCFKSHRGLRQGDPLTPYFLILMEDVLSRMLKKALKDTRVRKHFHPMGCASISHLLYADDMLLFVNGLEENLKS